MTLSIEDKMHVYNILKEWAHLEAYKFIPPEDVTKRGFMRSQTGEIMVLKDFIESRKSVLLGILRCIDYQLLPFPDIVALDSAIISLQANSPSITKMKVITEKLYSLIN